MNALASLRPGYPQRPVAAATSALHGPDGILAMRQMPGSAAVLYRLNGAIRSIEVTGGSPGRWIAWIGQTSVDAFGADLDAAAAYAAGVLADHLGGVS